MSELSSLTPANLSRQRIGPPAEKQNLSIIVPVLNEAALIRVFLQHLRHRVPDAEIILVDGGSVDGTAELAAGLCDRVLQSGPGRARQMNAGARGAHGDVLWFLHVDAMVPPGCAAQIQRVLDDPRAAAGYFRIRLPSSKFVYRLTDTFAHYAGLLLRIRCGDHGIFCRHQVFDQVGGFPETEIMEDVEFLRKIHGLGRVRAVRDRLTVSARRYEKMGPARLTAAYGLIAFLYSLGLPMSFLAHLYRRFCLYSEELKPVTKAPE